MAKPLPYYPLYVQDFDEDPFVLAMNLAEVGLYQLALNEAWKRGSIPDDPKALATVIRREPKDVKRAWPKVRDRFIENGTVGRLVNPRQEKEREIAAERSRKATKAIRTRFPEHTDVLTKPDSKDEHARARAYESSFVSSGLNTSTEEQTPPRARETSVALRCPPELEPMAILFECRGLYRQGGCPIADAHDQQILQYLLDIPVEKRPRIANYVKWAFVSGTWRDPSKTKRFLNLLRDGDWDVEITQRTLPKPSQGDDKVGSRAQESYDAVLRILNQRNPS